jgi:uncharacterized repeat protein (TIGR01451 family)
MKTVKRTFGLFGRLGMLATTLLLAQQAMAVGTDPGVIVTNQATVNYQVGGNNQAPIASNETTFLVDRRVDFTITQVGVGLTQVAPGDNDAFVEFLVTNVSNGVLDFNLLSAQLDAADGDVKGVGTTDSDVDMNNLRISVSTAPDGQPGGGSPGDGPAPAVGGPTVIDNLPEDDSIRVRIFADTPLALTNGQIANVRLSATAADPGTGANLVVSVAWTPGTIDNVFANASGADVNDNATESEADGFQVVSAALAITKSQAVISDPFSSGLAVPGARIEYSITIDNTLGAAIATGVSIADPVDGDVTFIADAYNSGASNISFDGGTSFCLADLADANGDGCTFDGTTLTISGREMPPTALTPIDVGVGATVIVSFVVEVPAT